MVGIHFIEIIYFYDLKEYFIDKYLQYNLMKDKQENNITNKLHINHGTDEEMVASLFYFI